MLPRLRSRQHGANSFRKKRASGATLVVVLTVVLTVTRIRTLGQAAGGKVSPQDVVSLQARPIARGAYARPATPQVARDYVLDRRDRERAIPPPPPGFNLVAGNESWQVYKRCAPDVRILRGE